MTSCDDVIIVTSDFEVTFLVIIEFTMSNPTLLLELMENFYRLEYEHIARQLREQFKDNASLRIQLDISKARAATHTNTIAELDREVATYEDLCTQLNNRVVQLEQYILEQSAPHRRVRRRLNYDTEGFEESEMSSSGTETDLEVPEDSEI